MNNGKSLLILLAALTLFAACDKKTKKDADNEPDVVIEKITQLPGISEAHGIIGEGTSMNVLEFITDSGDTLHVDMSGGQALTGGIGVGDEVQLVYALTDTTCSALMGVNLTALQHVWTQKGEDGMSQSLELNSGGRASTYDMKVEYTAWSVESGMLLLHAPKKIGDEAPAIVDTFEIMELTDRTLVLTHGPLTTVFDCDN